MHEEGALRGISALPGYGFAGYGERTSPLRSIVRLVGFAVTAPVELTSSILGTLIDDVANCFRELPVGYPVESKVSDSTLAFQRLGAALPIYIEGQTFYLRILRLLRRKRSICSRARRVEAGERGEDACCEHETSHATSLG